MTNVDHREPASLLARLLPLAFAVLQVLTPTLPFLGYGVPIGDQSARVETLITPAGWAFAIWSALYTGGFVFAIYSALPAQRDNPLLARLRGPAAGAFAGNALWALYVQGFGLTAVSVAIIVFTLLCLISVLRTIAAWQPRLSLGERLCAALPLSALASWLTVATVVNTASALRFHGIDGGAATPSIAAAMLIVAGIIGGLTLRRTRGNPPYLMVFLWALSGIYAAGGSRAEPVAVAAVLAAVAVVIGTAMGLRHGGADQWFRRRR